MVWPRYRINVSPHMVTIDNIATAEAKGEPTLSLQGMKNKTMEEIINKWTGELDRCSEQFKAQANDIRRWDAILVENGDKVNLSPHLTKIIDCKVVYRYP